MAIFKQTTREEVVETVLSDSINDMNKLIKKYENSHIYFTETIKEGVIGETILNCAKKEEIDIVIIGSNREDLTKRLTKNYIRYIIELSEKPILLFPI